MLDADWLEVGVGDFSNVGDARVDLDSVFAEPSALAAQLIYGGWRRGGWRLGVEGALLLVDGNPRQSVSVTVGVGSVSYSEGQQNLPPGD